MDNDRLMYYGKKDVFAYRTYMKPLEGVKEIPESDFSGRDNVVYGLNASVSVGGKGFLSSFTEGDNSKVVATDSMKNFILRHLATYEGATTEGFLAYAAKAFLDRYPHFERVEMSGEEIPFEQTSARSLSDDRSMSDVVFKHSRNERVSASTEFIRTADGGTVINKQRSSLTDLQLIKVKGNSFTGYIRDEYTTLPEDSNRPLFIYLNIHWGYENVADAYGGKPPLYVAAEQIRDIASSVFHELQTPSIQNLIYRIGCRILERFPQLKDVTFESQNRTWEAVVEEIEGSEGKVYTEPRPPYGFQVFHVTKADLGSEETTVSEARMHT